MERYTVDLSIAEFEELNRRFPPGDGSGLIGRRAEAIVKIHFKRGDEDCSFPLCSPGTDLQIAFSSRQKSLSIEIKGTGSTEIAWQQLKVSSQKSWQLLCEGLPVYRVCGVFAHSPTIYVLRYGVDFTLEPEARWAFKRLGQTSPIIDRTEERAALSRAPANTSRASKYDSLRRYLETQDNDGVTLSFRDLKVILGFPLPASAHTHQAYWANQKNTQNRPWTRAWTDAGFEVDGYHLSEDNGWVRFKRRGARALTRCCRWIKASCYVFCAR